MDENPIIKAGPDGLESGSGQGIFKFRDRVLAYCMKLDNNAKKIYLTRECQDPDWNASDIFMFSQFLCLCSLWLEDRERMPKSVRLN